MKRHTDIFKVSDVNCVSLKTTSSTHEESHDTVEKMEPVRNSVGSGGSGDKEMKEPKEVERDEEEIEAMDTAEVNAHVLGDQDHDKMAANTEEQSQQHPKKHHK